MQFITNKAAKRRKIVTKLQKDSSKKPEKKAVVTRGRPKKKEMEKPVPTSNKMVFD